MGHEHGGIALGHDRDEVAYPLYIGRNAEDGLVRLGSLYQGAHAVRPAAANGVFIEGSGQRQEGSLQMEAQNVGTLRRSGRQSLQESCVLPHGAWRNGGQKAGHAILRQRAAHAGQGLGAVVHQKVVDAVDVQVYESRHYVAVGVSLNLALRLLQCDIGDLAAVQHQKAGDQALFGNYLGS